MYSIFHGDCREVIESLRINVNAIITDPPYDASDLPIDGMGKICTGNILMFCKPENQFFKADEYLFWTKMPSTKNYTRSCGRFVEMILVKRKGSTFNKLHWSQMVGIYDDRHITDLIHPYEKPITLLERLIRIYTNPMDLILDPYMGSGSVGIAALNTGRRFIGIESNLEYYSIAQIRLDVFEKEHGIR